MNFNLDIVKLEDNRFPKAEQDGEQFVVYSPYFVHIAKWREKAFSFVADWGMIIERPLFWFKLPTLSELSDEDPDFASLAKTEPIIDEDPEKA